MAHFINEACVNGGVKPSEPLLFTCEVNEVMLLRVVLPSGDQEIISIGDSVANVALPSGFTAVSLDITVIDNSKRNFNLTLSIDSATLLEGGEIRCDNTTTKSITKAGCLINSIGKLKSLSYFHNFCIP